MKKVLIVSFFSTSRPGGSFRPAPLAKYLPEFGWEPVILTPRLSEHYDGLRIVETEYRDVLSFWRKLLGIKGNEGIRENLLERAGTGTRRSLADNILGFMQELVSYPDVFRGWKPFAPAAGRDLLRHEKMDAMISCHPVTSHIIASNLEKEFGLPWVADLPDLWSRNHNYSYSFVRRWRDTRLEKKTLAAADALTTVSQPLADELNGLHSGNRAASVPHGFPPEIAGIKAELTKKFTITYTGTIYHRRQSPEKLFAALSELVAAGEISGDDAEVRFYGPPDSVVAALAQDYHLSGVVKQLGRVSHDESLKAQRESQVLLLLDWDNSEEKGVYTTKIFEYLGAGRPVLATGGVSGNVVEELLGETGAGLHAVTHEQIREALKRMYREYRETGKVAFHGDSGAIGKYSHREMARKFAGILDRISA